MSSFQAFQPVACWDSESQNFPLFIESELICASTKIKNLENGADIMTSVLHCLPENKISLQFEKVPIKR